MPLKIENNVLLSVYGKNGTVVIPDGVVTVVKYAFKYLGITEVFFPDSVKEIQRSAFTNCQWLKKISIPENVDVTGIFHVCGGYTTKSIEIERRKITTKTTAVEKAAEPSAVPSKTDYKQLFIELAYIKELPEKENVLDRIFDDDIKIPFAVYLFTEYKSEKAQEYISGNFQTVMHYLVDKKDMSGINAVMSIENSKGA